MSDMTPDDAWTVLQFSPSEPCWSHISLARVSQQYRRLALVRHPDRCSPSRRAEATAAFQELRQAYDLARQHCVDAPDDADESSDTDCFDDEEDRDDDDLTTPSFMTCAMRLAAHYVPAHIRRLPIELLDLILHSSGDAAAVRFFQRLPRHHVAQIFAFLRDHRDTLGIHESIWSRLQWCMRQCHASALVHHFQVTLEDMMANRFLRIRLPATHDDDDEDNEDNEDAAESARELLVPTWMRESVFVPRPRDPPGTRDVVIQCTPAHLSPHVRVDDDNHVHVTLFFARSTFATRLSPDPATGAPGLSVALHTVDTDPAMQVGRPAWRIPASNIDTGTNFQQFTFWGAGPPRAWANRNGLDPSHPPDRTDVVIQLAFSD